MLERVARETRHLELRHVPVQTDALARLDLGAGGIFDDVGREEVQLAEAFLARAGRVVPVAFLVLQVVEFLDEALFAAAEVGHRVRCVWMDLGWWEVL